MGNNIEMSYPTVKLLVKLCARIYIFGIPTIAAMTGHAFGGGFMLAMSHDYRYMVERSGLICLPEIDLMMPLPASMAHLIKAKVTPVVFNEMMFGRRVTPEEALDMRIIHKTIDPESLMT